ncbi:16S rRNA (uracil1498-N3)-methyltransferase [Proteiniborus ethanoligenes]|uniref:Ribosomal RNA small subunit methyltransferase E n=1 Tax=Proteiniborus ethanoligenes TaxID=415015 RepID=A0A1H3R1R9_9FIRM|nr:RsmE family RNA methyltransferase [Proteiniborus ethanoligenes]TAH63013.1 MAG: 16S rRNA (uracil(1498)-N(3))-methyltransferase [Gottschalkiaceae bacterium]SDZ19764.1 16S rRNA (uracil1498-N3)-methyltransferase [Proteiniborus ethanoligenes]
MHRFFTDIKNIHEDKITIIGEDVKHIKNVLRLNVEDIITICDKNKTEYTSKILSINKESIVCHILDSTTSISEPPVDVVLYQGIPKSTKMDLIIQKNTELGVIKIIPIITDRTITRIQDIKKEEKKLERWNRIAEEAAKQSKRGIVPEVGGILPFKEMLKVLKNEKLIIVPYENEEKLGIKEALKGFDGEKINIIIGPEGGFEEWEINSLKSIGSKIVSLGPRILRTETAGFTASTIVLYELGDLGVIQ